MTWRKRLEARLHRGNPWAAISLGIIWLVLGVGELIINVLASHRQHWGTMTLWLVGHWHIEPRGRPVGTTDEATNVAPCSVEDPPSRSMNLAPTARLMWQTHGRPFELEGGATFRVDDRFRASWSSLT